MARALGGMIRTSLALALALRQLLTSTGPGHRVPGPAKAGQRQYCLNCRAVATRWKETDLFVCQNPGCRASLGVAECAHCFEVARTDDDYRWVCRPGHTTEKTRKCPCGRLGEPVGGGRWRCREEGCRPFLIADCKCGYWTAYHGYASGYQGSRKWHCELTGTVWSER